MKKVHDAPFTPEELLEYAQAQTPGEEYLIPKAYRQDPQGQVARLLAIYPHLVQLQDVGAGFCYSLTLQEFWFAVSLPEYRAYKVRLEERRPNRAGERCPEPPAEGQDQIAQGP